MNYDYANLHGPSKTFIGTKNGFYCVGPAANTSLYNGHADIHDGNNYTCPREGVKNWDPTWYSPVCRNWYNITSNSYNATQLRGSMTPLYKYAGDSTMGLTTCVPIQKGEEFGGAFCADIAPSGKLD